MSYTFDNVLAHDLITVIDRNDDIGWFVIQLRGINTHITIKLCRFMRSEETTFEVSHVIHTPTQMDAYHTSKPLADDPASALQRAVFGLTSFYQSAVNAGHKPCEDWLVEA